MGQFYIRANISRLPSVVGVMDRQGALGVDYDVEGSGFGFRVVRKLAASDAELPWRDSNAQVLEDLRPSTTLRGALEGSKPEHGTRLSNLLLGLNVHPNLLRHLARPDEAVRPRNALDVSGEQQQLTVPRPVVTT